MKRGRVADAHFADPRLAEIYDVLDGNRNSTVIDTEDTHGRRLREIGHPR